MCQSETPCATFAGATDTHALTSFVRFVRQSSTPVYEDDSPEDQWQLVSTMAEVLAKADLQGAGAGSGEHSHGLCLLQHSQAGQTLLTV